MAQSHDVVSHARSFVGVPYLHQGRTRHGLDCVGLVVRVVNDLGISDFDASHYGRVPSGRMMVRVLQDYCDTVKPADLRPGDLVHIAYDKHPQHLAILTDHGMVHADSTHGVVEHTFSDGFRAKMRGCYRFRGVN